MSACKFINIFCPECGANILVQYEYSGPDWSARDLSHQNVPEAIAKKFDGTEVDCICGASFVLKHQIRHELAACKSAVI